MLSRREFLQAQMMGITLIVVEPLHLLGSQTDRSARPLPWTHYVRIAGLDMSTQTDFTLLISLASGQLSKWLQLLTYSWLTAWTVSSLQVSLLELHPWIGSYAR